jgi:hypothetical protein
LRRTAPDSTPAAAAADATDAWACDGDDDVVGKGKLMWRAGFGLRVVEALVGRVVARVMADDASAPRKGGLALTLRLGPRV